MDWAEPSVSLPPVSPRRLMTVVSVIRKEKAAVSLPPPLLSHSPEKRPEMEGQGIYGLEESG